MPTTVHAVALICLLSLVTAHAAGETSRLVASLKAGKPQIIVTYGTSLTAGGAWVPQLKEALETEFPGLTTVINSGENAMWSKWGVDNLDVRVISKKPDAVFIEFAINDAYLEYKTSMAESQSNLINMVDRILAAKAGTEIFLMTMSAVYGVSLERRPQLKDYYQVYRDVAKQRKLKLIDNYPNWAAILAKDKERYAKLVPDTAHPTADACMEVIMPVILKALGLNGSPANAK